MRRELKLVLLVFFLVVGPAVVLSFLAGRVLGNWQVILQKRMEVAAARELENVVQGWNLRLDDARRELQHSLAVAPPVQVFPAYSASNAWISGLFLFAQGQGLIYPLGEDTNTAFRGREAPALPSRNTLFHGGEAPVAATHSAALIREYLQILEQPEVPPDLALRTRLRLAQAYRKTGQLNEARACLEPVVKDGGDGLRQDPAARSDPAASGSSARHEPSSPQGLRDPEDGFCYDIIALKILSELCEGAGDKAGARQADIELLRRVLDRYDGMAPFQRQLASLHIEKRLGDPAIAGQTPGRDAALFAQWRERKRGREWDRESRVRLEKEFVLLAQSGQVSGEAWTVVRIGTNEYWVTLAGPPGHPATPTGSMSWPGDLFIAIQLDRELLKTTLVRSASRTEADTGLAIEIMGIQDATTGPRPLLSERRMAPPLDRVTLAAYPADSQAFLANIQLQSRLYGWGGLVLIVSVVVGGWLMWREAVHEIRAARERSDFAAAVSHDLRTPLSSMRMLAESLYLGRIEDETKRRRFLETILKESDRLSRLTDRALYFIQFGQGALRYRMTEGDLGGLVKDVVETFAIGVGAEVREAEGGKRGDVSERGGAGVSGWKKEGNEGEGATTDDRPRTTEDGGEKWVIDLALSDDLPATRFDAGAMEQVVFNLLDNAVKYSQERKRIEVGIQEDASHRHIRVMVKDHGAGIAAKDLKRIFKAYQRGGGSGHTAGLGLGLALCRDVVKAHRGRIEVESRVGQGSTFTVILPAAVGV